jgi:hypothetical protein
LRTMEGKGQNKKGNRASDYNKTQISVSAKKWRCQDLWCLPRRSCG